MSRPADPTERCRQLEVEIARLKSERESWRRLLQKTMQVVGAFKTSLGHVAGLERIKTDRR